MRWDNFQTHGDAPERAFEAFAGQLFERWARKEYGAKITRLNFVNGAGGDGGVEVYAQLEDGSFVGLQAKWFRERLKDVQLRQISDSIHAAVKVRSELCNYCIAI